MPRIIQELKNLEEGINIKNEWYTFFCISGIFDKPARQSYINMKSSIGYFGCLKCEIMGVSIPFKNGHHRIFQDIKSELRNETNYANNLANVGKFKDSGRGVLGKSIFSKLKFYKIISGTNIDIMHSVFLGVIKHFFRYWFDSPEDKAYSFKSKIDYFNKKILTIKPPNYIPQAPRKLSDYVNFRAHEFQSFILYYCEAKQKAISSTPKPTRKSLSTFSTQPLHASKQFISKRSCSPSATQQV